MGRGGRGRICGDYCCNGQRCFAARAGPAARHPGGSSAIPSSARDTQVLSAMPEKPDPHSRPRNWKRYISPPSPIRRITRVCVSVVLIL